MKWRNSKERELLANGGSREQTLPTKNNPNPDLSDVKEDNDRSLKNESKINIIGSSNMSKDSDQFGTNSHDEFNSFGEKIHHEGFNNSESKMESLIPGHLQGGSLNHLPGKLQIKDLASLGSCFPDRKGGFSYSYPGDHDGEFSDEDINVTDDLTASNNEDSDID